MNDPVDNPSAAEAAREPFKGYKDAYKTLRALHTPISDEGKTEYLDRVRDSSTARYIAFRLLALRAVGEMSTRLAPFIPELEAILHADSAPLDLRQCDSIDAVRRAVSGRLDALRQKPDLKPFASARAHLPILYGLIRVWDDPGRFQAGIDAFAAAFERLNKPKRSSKATASNSLEILARAVVSRVPEKPLIGKSLPELLKISQALFRQAEEANRENLELELRVSQAARHAESMEEDVRQKLGTIQDLQRERDSLSAEVRRLGAALAEEKEHFTTLKGHSEEDRDRAVADAVARMRAEISRRVENIRLFADRERPNRQGILNLVAEIATALRTDGGER